MVVYLRTCLAYSCGIQQPHVSEISDWMDQAPDISLYQPSDRRLAQPAKQQRLATTEAAHHSILQYTRLLVQNIDIQASECDDSLPPHLIHLSRV